MESVKVSVTESQPSEKDATAQVDGAPVAKKKKKASENIFDNNVLMIKKKQLYDHYRWKSVKDSRWRRKAYRSWSKNGKTYKKLIEKLVIMAILPFYEVVFFV